MGTAQKGHSVREKKSVWRNPMILPPKPIERKEI
jgi:hypothetical protein